MIDVSQSVEHDHPNALNFLRADCEHSLAGTETEEEAEAAAEAQVRDAVFSQVHIPRHLDQMPMKQVRGRSLVSR